MKESGLKRIVIFSPYPTTQENLESFLRKYFEKDKSLGLALRYSKFGSIGESHDKKAKIGLGGEILIVYDRSLLPPQMHALESKMRESQYLASLRNLVELSKQICDEKRIPYLDYEGEIEKKEESALVAGVNRLKPQIYLRFELDDFFKP